MDNRIVKLGDEGERVVGAEQKAGSGARLGADALALVRYDRVSAPRDNQHIPCHQSSHVNRVPEQPGVQRVGAVAMRCQSSGNQVVVPAGESTCKRTE